MRRASLMKRTQQAGCQLEIHAACVGFAAVPGNCRISLEERARVFRDISPRREAPRHDETSASPRNA